MKRVILSLAVSGLTTVASMATGCAPEPAPTDVEDLSRFLWDRFEIKGDTNVGLQEAEIRDAMNKVHDSVIGTLNVTDDNPYKSELKDIEPARVKDLDGVADRIDSLPLVQGMVVANIEHCTMQQHQNLMLGNRTLELHADAFETYNKTFNDPVGNFGVGDGQKNTITWNTEYRIVQPPLGSQYSATSEGGARRIKASDNAAESPFGDILMDRVHLPKPAVFDQDGSEFTLDFQMEAYEEIEPGKLLHFYVMWRRMKFGPVDSTQTLMINGTLDGMVSWDKENEVACADGSADKI